MTFISEIWLYAGEYSEFRIWAVFSFHALSSSGSLWTWCGSAALRSCNYLRARSDFHARTDVAWASLISLAFCKWSGSTKTYENDINHEYMITNSQMPQLLEHATPTRHSFNSPKRLRESRMLAAAAYVNLTSRPACAGLSQPCDRA